MRVVVKNKGGGGVACCTGAAAVRRLWPRQMTSKWLLRLLVELGGSLRFSCRQSDCNGGTESTGSDMTCDHFRKSP